MKYLCCNSTIFYQQDKDFPNYRKIAGLNKSETDFTQNEKNHYPKTKILHALCLCSQKRA